MIHRRTKAFKKLFDRLPKDIQELATKNFAIFKQNEHHPSLEFKRLADELRDIWSIRVGNSWRALGKESDDGQTIHWFWIGTHERYNTLVGTSAGRKLLKALKALKALNEEEELFEMPKEINATEFNLDDPKVNRRVAMDFKLDGEKIEQVDDRLSLWTRGNRMALLVEDPDRPTKLIYYVQWKEIFHKFVGHRAITQVAVWADKLDPRAKDIARKIFWEHLLPLYEVLMTDALQTPDGQRFWRNRVGEALEHHLRVYYLNLMPSTGGVGRELIEIRDLQHFADLAAEKEFWGREDLHRARKIIISNIEL